MKRIGKWALCLALPAVVACTLFTGKAPVTYAFDGEAQSAGIAAVIALDSDPASGWLMAEAPAEETAPAAEEVTEEENTEEEDFGYVFANVEESLNIREQPDETSAKVGVLYKDNGGRVLAHKDGWTKLQSGDVIGWAQDKYLYNGDDAEARADEIAKAAVTVEADALRVRAAASEDAELLGLAVRGEKLTITAEEADGWVAVEYGDTTGYVRMDYVESDYHFDEGETVAQIRKREKEEEERKAREAAEKAAAEAAAKAAAEKAAAAKAKASSQAAPVAAGGNDTMLLAALIYCEAGNQPHNGKVAVGSVVMNRVRSGSYPSTIHGVIYQAGQFGPARTGKVASVLNSGRIPQDCIAAASEALAGASPVGGATQFRRAGGHAGTVIGAHVFW